MEQIKFVKTGEGENYNYSYEWTLPQNYDWEYVKVIAVLINDNTNEVVNAGMSVYLGGNENAQPFFAADPTLPHSRVIVIVGNENAGIDPGILHICDRVFSLPMYGFKESLNVAVAFGIVAYHLCYAVQMQPEN